MPKFHLGGGRYGEVSDLFGEAVPADDAREAGKALANLAKPFIFNNTAEFHRKHQIRLAEAYSGDKIGDNRYRIVCVGDSLTDGTGAGTGADFCTGAKVKAYPAVLAKLFRNAGFIVSEDNFGGDGRLPTAGTAAVTLYDPKLTFANSGWTRASPMVFGGNTFINSTTGDTLTFTPAVAGQNIDVYYCTLGGGGTFRITDSTGDGTLGADVVTSGGPNLLKTKRTRTLSAKPIQITRQSGGGVYIPMIDQWANDTQISIYNCGAYGVSSVDWTGTAQPYSSLNAMSVLAPDLIIIQLGANNVRDALTNYESFPLAAAAFKGHIDTMVATWQAIASAPEIVLVASMPNAASDTAWAPFIQALYDIAVNRKVPLVNLYDRFINRDRSLRLYQDTVHLYGAGYADVAFAHWELLRPQ